VFPPGHEAFLWSVLNPPRPSFRLGFPIGSGNVHGFVEVSLEDGFSRNELMMLTVLSALIADLPRDSRHDPDASVRQRLGKALQDVRVSVRQSQEGLADEIGIPEVMLSAWEIGSEFPEDKPMYRWCQVLGLVCPPKTALVRVIDFSPELLRFLQEDPTRLRSLTPDQFERFVAERLDRMGYNVTLAGTTNQKDGGIDLIAVPRTANVGSVVIAGQMKHHRDRKTEREAVDRLLSWKDSYFGVGLLVTNTAFTKDAVWTAGQERNRHFLRLRDFIDLKRWLEGQFGSESDWREIPDRIELAPGVFVEIPKPRMTTDFELFKK
jgi:transcriptional regulator with XRE-family HTH domain